MPQSRPNTEYAKRKAPPMRQVQSKLTEGHAAFKRTLLALSAVGLGWLSGCSAPPTAPTGPQKGSPTGLPGAQRPGTSPMPAPPGGPGAPKPEAVRQDTSPPSGPVRSAARNAQDYRKDAASHLYALHSQHIYKGRLPPMLEAVGVLNVDIDRHGSVKSVQWMRAPRHVPQVMQQIERMVKAAAPYPLPLHMSQVTYTDVWLWHQSGKFQLDTLTEGQD